MGLFDVFKKKDNKSERENSFKKEKDYEVNYSVTEDGRLQVDFYDESKFYDTNTTRLVVDNKSIILADQKVRNCIVSWYNRDDAVYLAPEYEGESLGASDYKGILAQIDPELLQRDEEYCLVVMRKLLDKKRVTKYLEDGLKEKPEHPCGKYVGGVNLTEKGYVKSFSIAAGEASHNSDYMVNSRKEYQKKIEEQKLKSISDRKKQIQSLQKEIDDLSK